MKVVFAIKSQAISSASDGNGGEVCVGVEGDGVPSGVKLGFGIDVEIHVTGGDGGVIVEGDGVSPGVRVGVDGTDVEFSATGGEVGVVIEDSGVVGDDAPMVFVRYITSTTPTCGTTGSEKH